MINRSPSCASGMESQKLIVRTLRMGNGSNIFALITDPTPMTAALSSVASVASVALPTVFFFFFDLSFVNLIICGRCARALHMCKLTVSQIAERMYSHWRHEAESPVIEGRVLHPPEYRPAKSDIAEAISGVVAPFTTSAERPRGMLIDWEAIKSYLPQACFRMLENKFDNVCSNCFVSQNPRQKSKICCVNARWIVLTVIKKKGTTPIPVWTPSAQLEVLGVKPLFSTIVPRSALPSTSGPSFSKLSPIPFSSSSTAAPTTTPTRTTSTTTTMATATPTITTSTTTTTASITTSGIEEYLYTRILLKNGNVIQMHRSGEGVREVPLFSKALKYSPDIESADSSFKQWAQVDTPRKIQNMPFCGNIQNSAINYMNPPKLHSFINMNNTAIGSSTRTTPP